MFSRPTCMQACLDSGHDYDYCRIWCEPIYMVPTYSYSVQPSYTAPLVTPYSSQQYQTYAYGQQTDPRWECYRQCIRSGGSAASCCYYCELC
ncbi:TPA: hypothetical protein QCZ17_003270 [Bacillus cereus]|nr:hypothetical protein [Bacillus cereus]